MKTILGNPIGTFFWKAKNHFGSKSLSSDWSVWWDQLCIEFSLYATHLRRKIEFNFNCLHWSMRWSKTRKKEYFSLLFFFFREKRFRVKKTKLSTQWEWMEKIQKLKLLYEFLFPSTWYRKKYLFFLFFSNWKKNLIPVRLVSLGKSTL